MKTLGFLLIEQMEQMIYYLNLKYKKNIYIRNIIRELSKDVFYLFYLFYLFHSTDGNRCNIRSVTVETLENVEVFLDLPQIPQM